MSGRLEKNSVVLDMELTHSTSRGEALRMSEGPIKCKIISFRVSDEEYEAVKETSWKQGFPSVSVFARATTLTFNSSEVVQPAVDVEINRLWRRIEALTTALESIAARAGVILASFHMG